MFSIMVFVLWIILLTNFTSANDLIDWYQANKDKGIVKDARDVINEAAAKFRGLLPKVKPNPPAPVPVENLPPVPSPLPTEPTTLPTTTTTTTALPKPTTTVSLVTTTETTTSSTTTTTPEAKTQPPVIQVEPSPMAPDKGTDSQSKENDWTHDHFIWKGTTTILLLTVFVCVCFMSFLFTYNRRRKKKANIELLPMGHSTAIVNRNYLNLHEHIDALKYDTSYEIDRKNVQFRDYLGHGNFGVVFDGSLLIKRDCRVMGCFDKLTSSNMKTVAIKTVGETTSPGALELRKKILEDELKLMCIVGSHPNIVTLIGAVTLEQEMMIIMDKCSSGNLYKFLISRKNNFIPQFEKLNNENQEETYIHSTVVMPVEYEALVKNDSWKNDLSKGITTAHLLSFAMQIALGMEYLASLKCVHRDLAARNILLTPEGLCKISDFGLAKRIGYKEYYRTDTVHELPCRWMSVESLRDSIFTVESDIWSYGILLYEIFSLGGVPYPTLTGDVTDSIINGTRNDQPKYCPDPIYHQMKLCWSTEANKRPSFQNSAEKMKQHQSKASPEILNKVMKELCLEEKRQESFSKLRSKIRRNRAP